MEFQGRLAGVGAHIQHGVDVQRAEPGVALFELALVQKQVPLVLDKVEEEAFQAFAAGVRHRDRVKFRRAAVHSTHRGKPSVRPKPPHRER